MWSAPDAGKRLVAGDDGPVRGEQIHDIGRRRAWAVWFVAIAVYVLAVFHRSSLGVAGLLASDRFGIAGTELAFFTVLQLVVYAAMQVPVGVLLDRFGPRALLVAGLVMMTGAQFAFAFADSFGVAVLARGFVGAGDAMVFVTVIRLVTVWFGPRQIPMITQITGWSGQLGSIAAAAPLSLLLTHLGWTRTFALTSTIGVVLVVAVLATVKNSPYAAGEAPQLSLAALAREVGLVWGNPGTRLGFWVHFTAQFPHTVFMLLWGFPFLVRGQGWSEVAAGTLMMAMTGWVILAGFVLGALMTRQPLYRSRMAVVVACANVVVWTVVLLRPEPAPTWLILVLAAVVATGGPTSVIGFDIARTFTPASAVGRATGLVNVGGFVAALVTMALIGMTLDFVQPGGMDLYDLDDFRWAMATQYVCWGLGIVQMVRLRRLAIGHLDTTAPGAVDTLRSGGVWTTHEQ